MKVSKNWLKELVDLKVSPEELVRLLPLRIIAVKDEKPDYIELDMKGYNRADLLSLRGVAYEVAAITDSSVKFREEEGSIWQKGNLPKVNVSVEDSALTPVYCIAKIENLKVDQSNETWVKKLNNSGIRSVNNLADITNLIMVEYGQPLHAFDASQVTDETIIVKTAKEDEELVTLDGKVRKLTSEDLLITDPKKTLGLAGVMGGKNSEVSQSTSTILLEAAIFDPKTLRKTATRLGLISEASKRFYHGLTKKRLFQALNSAIKMYEGLGGKLTALTIVDGLTDKTVTMNLTQSKVNSLIGVDVPSSEVEKYLRKLHFQLERAGEDWKVTVPYFRLDVGIEEDLIEEVARMYGYEKIPATPLNTNVPNNIESLVFGLLGRLKKVLSQLGLTEVQTYSYYSTEVMNALGFGNQKKDKLIKIANPISKETEYLRANNWPNLVEVIAKNEKHGFKDMAVFEVGKIYYINGRGEAAEKYSLSIALSDSSNPLAKLHDVFTQLNKELNLAVVETGKEKGANLELFHPVRFIQLAKNGRIVGGMAEVHKRVTDKLGTFERVAVLEIGLNKI